MARAPPTRALPEGTGSAFSEHAPNGTGSYSPGPLQAMICSIV